jgi:hypothetical protein
MPTIGSDVFAMVEARDRAGNVAIYSNKGRLSAAFTATYVPSVLR